MIIPDLLVRDIAKSLAFYRDELGFSVMFMISADQQVLAAGQDCEAVFAIVVYEEAELMLQRADSLAAELPDQFSADQAPAASGTIYVRGYHPDQLPDAVDRGRVIKGPFMQWYGMKEIYLTDPDGYVICLGAAEGAAPT